MKIFYPFTSILFVVLVMLLVIGYTINITVSAAALCICYIFKRYSWVIGLGDFISDCLESLNEMIWSLSEEAEGVLSKKRNKVKSNS